MRVFSTFAFVFLISCGSEESVSTKENQKAINPEARDLFPVKLLEESGPEIKKSLIASSVSAIQPSPTPSIQPRFSPNPTPIATATPEPMAKISVRWRLGCSAYEPKYGITYNYRYYDVELRRVPLIISMAKGCETFEEIEGNEFVCTVKLALLTNYKTTSHCIWTIEYERPNVSLKGNTITIVPGFTNY